MIVDWARKYIGLDYKLGAIGPDKFDCWGLVVWIYRNEFDLDINDGIFYLTKEDRVEQLRQHIGSWIKIDDPIPGDCILILIGGKLPHCGVYVGDNKMIHTIDGMMSSIENVKSPRWKSRFDGYYRYSENTG